MKIRDLAILNESLKFTSSNFKLVDAKAKDFKIGIEYEFHIDDAYLEGSDDEEPYFDEVAYNEAVNDYADGRKNSDFEMIHDHMEDFVISVEIEQIDEKIKTLNFQTSRDNSYDMFDNDITYGDLSEIAPPAYLDSLNALIQDISFETPDFVDINKFIFGYTGVSVMSVTNDLFSLSQLFKSNPSEAVTEPETLVDLLSVLRRAKKMADELEPLGSGQSLMLDYEADMSGDLDDAYRENATYEVESGDFYSEPESASGSSESAVEFFKNNMPSGVAQYLEDVTIDPSVDSGCEVITEPLPIMKALEVMKLMFGFIREYGSTSETTGMHINISHRLMLNSLALDPLKLVILADPDYHQGFTRRNDRQMWRPRQYVERMMGNVESQYSLTRIADEFIEDGYAGLEYGVELLLNRREKYQAINLAHSNLTAVDQRRIEFRFFGGGDYEDKYETIRSDMYYMCYILLGALDKDFLVKEYRQELYKYVDKACKDVLRISFADLVTSRKSQSSDNKKIDQLNLNKKINSKG